VGKCERLEYKMESLLVEEEGPVIAPPYTSCQHTTPTKQTSSVKETPF
jgi:hypothetical protein